MSKNNLVIDTETISEQESFGFKVIDDNGDDVEILSVNIDGLHSNRVTLLCSKVISYGYKVSYGHRASINRADAFTGGSGNLRDTAGDFIKYNNKPMHNWCVIFEAEV